MQQDHAETVTAITEFLAKLDAAKDEDEWVDIVGDGVEVRVNGQVWWLELEANGWEAFPAHEDPELGWPSTQMDDTDGEPCHLGGPDLTPEAIVALLAAERTSPAEPDFD